MLRGLMWAHAEIRETLDFTDKKNKQVMGIEETSGPGTPVK